MLFFYSFIICYASYSVAASSVIRVYFNQWLYVDSVACVNLAV